MAAAGVLRARTFVEQTACHLAAPPETKEETQLLFGNNNNKVEKEEVVVKKEEQKQQTHVVYEPRLEHIDEIRRSMTYIDNLYKFPHIYSEKMRFWQSTGQLEKWTQIKWKDATNSLRLTLEREPDYAEALRAVDLNVMSDFHSNLVLFKSYLTEKILLGISDGLPTVVTILNIRENIVYPIGLERDPEGLKHKFCFIDEKDLQIHEHSKLVEALVLFESGIRIIFDFYLLWTCPDFHKVCEKAAETFISLPNIRSTEQKTLKHLCKKTKITT